MTSRHAPVITSQPRTYVLENEANELVEGNSKINNNKDQEFNFTEETDPFRVRLNFSTLDWIKMGLMGVTVVPLRIVALFISVVFCYLMALIGLIGMDRSKPVTGHRLFLRKVIAFGGRTCCRCVGFQTVKITGTQVSKEIAPVLVVAPHSSFFDGLALFFSGLPFLVSRVENLQIPFIGKLIEFSSAICVDREDPDSRHNTVQEIIRRVTSDQPWPQFIIFPEGTTTNRKALMNFKPGGFVAGKTVQPVLIRYHNQHDTISWTWDMPHGAATCFFASMFQWRLYPELEFLPPYTPSLEEVNDSNLFASNVRKLMARELNVPLCDVTFQDLKAKYAAKEKDQ